ncbi:MAG: LLM class F420-dependent oxidoreductase, partial [Chloroflexi bacterium]|nr:LLM class F420-dependent oxidoreductase [Chloroflexota bacterium]
RRYAEQAGRDPSEIQVSVKAPLYDSGDSSGPRRRFSGSPDEVCQDVQTYADVGVTHLIFDFRAADPHQTEDRMARFAEEVMAVT